MLSGRILATLEFFDLSDLPLTAWEVGKFLVSDKQYMLAHQDENYDLTEIAAAPGKVSLDTIVKQLDAMKSSGEIAEHNGFYCLPGRTDLVASRLSGYKHGLVRERIIQRFSKFFTHLPFIRGIGLCGSQALGLPKPNSDIDLLIITDPKRMWFARFCVTVTLHLFGVRRYKRKITNRFCLNHYLAGPRPLDRDRNLYTAAEYLKLRPVAVRSGVKFFQRENQSWISRYFPQATFLESPAVTPSSFQQLSERWLSGRLGEWLNQLSRRLQRPRILADEFIIAEDHELSFHPANRKRQLFDRYFGGGQNF